MEDTNVLLQHKPHILQVVDQAKKGKLLQTAFPGMEAFDYRRPADTVLVFALGGATYMEASYLSQVGGVVYGGSSIVSYKDFLSAVE